MGRIPTKTVRHSLILVIIVFAGIQFVRPDRTNPPVSNPLNIENPEAETILRRSCFDCHSNETNWPWYSEVAPVSWLVADHVRHGRGHVNFSDWNESKSKKRLSEICDEVSDGEMPIWNYLLAHPDARLSKEDVSTLCTWSKARLAQMIEEP